ncbi:hypothetical protein ACEWY4_001592 [Coilia grayii]|uniref:Uncharacterized protein n=1 Tax=Coilia grayii TaxID=363190 RepID=A0ABD1KTD6_9TELE
MTHTKDRFAFTKHLVSATLLQGDLFQQHSRTFPDSALETTVEAYPSLDKARLKTELSLIYDDEEFQNCSGALALYQVLMANNLQDTFTETVSLLNILITTPMTTSESERPHPCEEGHHCKAPSQPLNPPPPDPTLVRKDTIARRPRNP